MRTVFLVLLLLLTASPASTQEIAQCRIRGIVYSPAGLPVVNKKMSVLAFRFGCKRLKRRAIVVYTNEKGEFYFYAPRKSEIQVSGENIWGYTRPVWIVVPNEREAEIANLPASSRNCGDEQPIRYISLAPLTEKGN